MFYAPDKGAGEVRSTAADNAVGGMCACDQLGSGRLD